MIDTDGKIILCFAAYVIGTTILCAVIYEFLLWAIRKGKTKLIAKLRSSDKFMAWLYSDEKSLSEQIYEEFANAQVSFIRTDWRNY